jgi:predicted nucleotidyltransferase component of viral defense system
MTGVGPVLLIRNSFELGDVVEKLNRDARLVEQDFALMTIAAGLVAEYGDALCFKGGFVLRHAFGHERFSKDIDATRINPPKHKLDSAHMAETIEKSGMRNLLSLKTGPPATDSGHSLDFSNIRFKGPLSGGFVSVEVSYREEVMLGPSMIAVGYPYYEPFEIPVMQLDEIVAEKLRALAQRERPTDLADIAMILARREFDSVRIRELVVKKIRSGRLQERIQERILAMGAQYDDAVSAVAPDAPSYAVASEVLERELSGMLP